MYHPKDIIDLIAGNVRKTGNPFGIPKFAFNNWWKGTEVNRQGEALLFTGLMYQFVPYIAKSTAYLARFEDTWLTGYVKYGKYVPKFLAGLGLATITSGKEKNKYNSILKDMAGILTKSGVDFFYDPKLDDYSGILLYDLGDQEGFIRHAEKVADKLARNGVRKLITVDPHTTYALKVLYPKITGKRFEVKTYFELLNLRSKNGSRRITIHDPCFYGRYLELSDVPARVLADLEIECAPVRNSGLHTNCCGGPAESISPKLSEEVVGRRMEELGTTGAPLVAMCPICLGNLRKAGVEVEDLATLIAGQVE
jgi:Fe-S oxidoreductase